MDQFLLFGDSVQRQEVLNSLLHLVLLLFPCQDPGVAFLGAHFIVKTVGLGHVGGALASVVGLSES